MLVRVFLLSLIIIGSVGVNVHESAARGEEAGTLNLTVIYERHFDVPVLDVIFDTETVTLEEAMQMGWKEEAFTEDELEKGKVPVFYPRVILISRGRELSWLPDARRNSYYAKEIRFYDKNGKIKKRLFLKEYGEEKIFYSPGRKYVLVSRRPTEWAPEYSGGVLYDLNGKAVWEIKGPTPIAVSDEGYSAACYLDWQVPPAPGGDFYVYNPKGKLIATVENPLKEETTPLFAEFSRDGNFAILVFSGEEDRPTLLELIGKKGKIKWKYEFSEYRFSGTGGEAHLVPPVGVIGTIYKGTGSSNLFFLSWDGKLEWINPLNSSTYMGCRFSHDGGKVYTWTLSGGMRCFDIKTGDVLWKYEGTCRWTELYEHKNHLVLKGHPDKVFLFDGQTGKLESKIEFPGENIFLTVQGGRIFVIKVEDKSILGFKIERVEAKESTIGN